jgi:hypothetical protein
MKIGFEFSAFPIGLERFLKLPKGSHAWVAQIVGQDARSHDVSLSFLR